MNLYLEYLIRTKLIRKFLNYPCSIFVECGNFKKIIIIVKKLGSTLIQHWDVYSCSPQEALPPMYEYKVEDAFDNPYVVPVGFKLLHYRHQSVVTGINTRRHPMDEETYNNFCEQICNSWRHNNIRRNWLWEAFVNVYQIKYIPEDLWRYFDDWAANLTDHAIEQDFVREKMPKKWKYWQMWVKRFMPELCRNDRVSSELIFTSFYT